MASVDQNAREIAIKIVYCGPGLAGKTSSLQFIHRMLRPDSRGQIVSLATGVDRTLYFDFMPVKLPRLRGYAMRVQLYTVPGQVHYNSTRLAKMAAKREAGYRSLGYQTADGASLDLRPPDKSGAVRPNPTANAPDGRQLDATI